MEYIVKKLTLLASLAVILSGCAVGGAGITANENGGLTTTSPLANTLIAATVQAKCVTELDNNTYWKTASRVLTANKKQELQTEVCSCVGQKSTSSVTAADLLAAAMDKTSQANLASRLVTQTLNACVVDTLKL